MESRNVIEVKNVSKTYVNNRRKLRKEAVKDVSFTIEEGSIFGLLGPNGAGKTTLIKMMVTLLIQDTGSIKIFDKDTLQDTDEVRKMINFIFGGERGLYSRLSAKENLLFFGSLYGVSNTILKERVELLLQLVKLYDRKDERVETFSKGMKQRLQIARGLINNPKVLFMDEPTLGLDPVGAEDLRNIINGLKEENKTIIMTTHSMQDVEKLCDAAAFINEGRIMEYDKMINLKERYLKVGCNDLEEIYKHLMVG